MRHSAGEAPLLVVPSLRGADGVDGTTVSFLLAANLKLQKKKEEEEERRRKELEEEDRSVRESLERAQRILDRAASKRKRKKRKKRKLPRCCRRPCDHQRRVPAVSPQTLGIPVVTQRQVPTMHSFILPVQLLDKVFDVPVVVLRQVPGLMGRKTVEVPQLQSIESRRHPFRAAEGDPHGPVYLADHKGSSVAVRCQVVDALIAHVVFDMPVVVQRQVLMVQWTSGFCPYSALSLVRQRIHALRQSTDLWWFAVFSAMLGSTADTNSSSDYGG